MGFIDTEIKRLVEKGVIVPSCHETGEFVSTIFVRPKPDGSHRLILNLKRFNEHVSQWGRGLRLYRGSLFGKNLYFFQKIGNQILELKMHELIELYFWIHPLGPTTESYTWIVFFSLRDFLGKPDVIFGDSPLTSLDISQKNRKSMMSYNRGFPQENESSIQVPYRYRTINICLMHQTNLHPVFRTCNMKQTVFVTLENIILTNSIECVVILKFTMI